MPFALDDRYGQEGTERHGSRPSYAASERDEPGRHPCLRGADGQRRFAAGAGSEVKPAVLLGLRTLFLAVRVDSGSYRCCDAAVQGGSSLNDPEQSRRSTTPAADRWARRRNGTLLRFPPVFRRPAAITHRCRYREVPRLPSYPGYRGEVMFVGADLKSLDVAAGTVTNKIGF